MPRRLITSPDRRLAVDQIKHHPFFYGVDWAAIRNIEAPFIPRLRSITDTSYFPTDELEQVPDEPVNADSAGANKDLAFLGCVLFAFQSGCCAVSHFDVRSGLMYTPQVHVQTVHDFLTGVLIAHMWFACLSPCALLPLFPVLINSPVVFARSLFPVPVGACSIVPYDSRSSGSSLSAHNIPHDTMHFLETRHVHDFHLSAFWLVAPHTYMGSGTSGASCVCFVSCTG